VSRKGAETELLLISEAVARLKVGMYGNLKQPEPIAKIKEEDERRRQPRPSIGWGPQKEDAAERIYEAIVQGQLSVFVLPTSTDDEMHRSHLQVPLGVLKRMIRTRGGLPDHAIQPLRIFAKDPITDELRVALLQSALNLRRREFDAWYEAARKKRNWPSHEKQRSLPDQHPCAKPPMGRPSKQSDLRTPILALVNKGRWCARQKIADLVRLLKSKEIIATRDTLSRTVDQLFKETGEQAYRRRVRRRSKVKRDDPRQSTNT
jgi:hypothetical protein